MKIIIFDENSYNNFYPLSQTRPLWELICGTFSFKQRLELFLKSSKLKINDTDIYFFSRDLLVQVIREKNPEMKINDFAVFEKNEDFLFINSLLVPSNDLPDINLNTALVKSGKIAAAKTGKIKIDPAISIEDNLNNIQLEKFETDCIKPDYIWNLIDINPGLIEKDFTYYKSRKNFTDNNVTILGDRSLVYIDENVKIEPYVVINAEKGSVVILENSEIKSFTRIEGPAYIGKNTILFGANIREGTSIGDWCRIGGEVEESIFHAYSNKYHDGFIGHSYIGEWVNLGAMTTNSDLKNNYSAVKVYIPKKRKATGSMKVGCFIGDYAKTSIGTLINTGTSIGTGAMLVHSGSMASSHIPPFSWFINADLVLMDWLGDFLKASEDMMKRRGKTLTPAISELLTMLYSQKGN